MGSLVRSLRLHGGLPRDTAVELDARTQVVVDEIYNVQMDDNDDVVGTEAEVAFQVTNYAHEPINFEMVLQLAVFADIDLVVPSPNAVLSDATIGSILYGEGTAAMKVKTNATGRFVCKVTNFAKETVFVGCDRTFKTPVLDGREFDSITFS